MASRLKFGSDRGQSLVLFLVLLPPLVAAAALVIDGGHAFAQKRQMQNAADAAALAAAQELGPALGPCDAACMALVQSKVAAKATDYSEKNDWSGPPATLPPCTQPSDTNCFTWPYNGSNGKVEVRLRNDVDTTFASVIPFAPGFLKAGARAVASATGGTAIHCVFDVNGDGVDDNEDADPNNDIEDPDHYLNTTPPCKIPARPTQSGTQVTEPAHCTFDGDPPVDNPDQYLTTNPPCTGPFSGGVNGAMALVMSRECDAISYNGAGGGSVGTLVTNGGVWFSGNDPKRIDKLGYDAPGCPDHPTSPPSGTSQCDNSGNFLCAKELFDFSNLMPLNWPVPPPPEPTQLPLGTTWNPSAHYASSCIDLGTGNVTFGPASGPPGIYCLRGGGSLSLNGDLTTGDGYTFFALGGGQILVSSNGTKIKFYWPSACGARPTGPRPPSFTCFGRTISGYDPQTLFYATSTVHDQRCEANAICISGGNSSVEGDMFAVAPRVFPPPDRSP